MARNRQSEGSIFVVEKEPLFPQCWLFGTVRFLELGEGGSWSRARGSWSRLASLPSTRNPDPSTRNNLPLVRGTRFQKVSITEIRISKVGSLDAPRLYKSKSGYWTNVQNHFKKQQNMCGLIQDSTNLKVYSWLHRNKKEVIECNDFESLSTWKVTMQVLYSFCTLPGFLEHTKAIEHCHSVVFFHPLSSLISSLNSPATIPRQTASVFKASSWDQLSFTTVGYDRHTFEHAPLPMSLGKKVNLRTFMKCLWSGMYVVFRSNLRQGCQSTSKWI